MSGARECLRTPGGGLPPRIETQALQHNYHRHDHRRHAAPPDIGEQIGEHLVREKLKHSRRSTPYIESDAARPSQKTRRRPLQIRVNRQPSQRHPLIQPKQHRCAVTAPLKTSTVRARDTP